jgi:hypothetical protein
MVPDSLRPQGRRRRLGKDQPVKKETRRMDVWDNIVIQKAWYTIKDSQKEKEKSRRESRIKERNDHYMKFEMQYRNRSPNGESEYSSPRDQAVG